MLTVRETSAENNAVYYSDEAHFDEPVVVLMNGETSDVAEAFCAALQDIGKAKLVGDVTKGKGVGQRDIPLSDGTAIRISTYEYVTPNGLNFHKTGITPDVSVSLSPEKYASFLTLNDTDDDQLQTAAAQLRTLLGLS